jgi:hypothetical protein
MTNFKLLILLCFVLVKFYAQTPDTAFISQYTKNKNLIPDNDKDSPFARWKRYESFWTKRLGPSTSFELYEKAFHTFYQEQEANQDWLIATPDRSLYLTTPNTNLNAYGKWKVLGPHAINGNALSLGRCDRVQIDPWDKTGKTIYVMSRSAIFVTNDGGKNWNNFFTDGAFPAQAFSEMVLARDKKTGKKYIYLAVGGDMMRYINQSYADGMAIPFYGLFRLEIGKAKWENLTGNLACEGMLGQKLSSLISKVLIDPDDINRVFLGTSEGVFYLSAKAIRSDTACKGMKTPTWIKTKHTQPVMGLGFDYSDAKRKAIYCSFRQLYHCEDVYAGKPFENLSSTDDSKKNSFNDLESVPSSLMSLQTNRIPESIFSHLDIATHKAHPSKVFISMGYDYQYLVGTTPRAIPNMAFIVYDKKSVASFPENYTILRNYPGYSLHLDKNFIHVSNYQTNLVGYVIDFWGSTEIYDVKNSKTISTHRAPHADTHGFDFSPNKKDAIFSNDGGVYKCDINTSNKLECINGKGLVIGTFYGGSVFEGDGKKAMGGFQDNYTHETDDIYSTKGWTTTSMSTGDGDRALFLPNGNVYYNSCYNDGYAIFMRDATTNNTLSFTKPCRMSNVWNKVYKSPTGKEEIYITGEDLYFTRKPYNEPASDCGSSFYQLSEYNNENKVGGPCYQTYMSDFDISSDQKTIYAVFANNAAIWLDKCREQSGSFISCIKTTVGGKNNPAVSDPCTSKNCWTNLPDMNTLKLKGFTTNVIMHPANPNQVWLGSSGYSFKEQPEFNRRVVYSADGGNTFVDFSEGLPDFSVNRLVVAPKEKTGDYELYLATDVGVYYRTSEMKKWQRLGTGLPYVIVSDLQVDLKNKKIYAFTFGRGMWVMEMPVKPLQSIGTNKN